MVWGVSMDQKKHTQRTFFCMLQHSPSDGIGPEKGIFFAYWAYFFTRKINISKIWFLMKIVCIKIMYFSEMFIIKDGKDIPNRPFLQWPAINSHLLCFT